MNGESLNRGEANAFNFKIIPIVMAICSFWLFTLTTARLPLPSISARSSPVCWSPELASSLFPRPFGNLRALPEMQRDIVPARGHGILCLSPLIESALFVRIAESEREFV